MIIKWILLLSYVIPPVWADSTKTIKLCENSVAMVLISPRGTVLDFPSEPQKVVLGSKNAFSVEYIRNDLAISPTTMGARSNLFVYLQGRRFSLDLVTSSGGGVTLYFIKDCLDDRVKVKKVEK